MQTTIFQSSGWQAGRFVSFPVLCLLAYGDTCSQVLVFTSIWGTHTKRVSQWHFSCRFPSIWVFGHPPNTAKQGKTQNDKSTLFYPPQGGSVLERNEEEVPLPAPRQQTRIPQSAPLPSALPAQWPPTVESSIAVNQQ